MDRRELWNADVSAARGCWYAECVWLPLNFGDATGEPDALTAVDTAVENRISYFDSADVCGGTT